MKEKFVLNLIGYVRHVEENRIFYREMFSKLLATWSCHTSFTNTSYEQHLFLTKCILICFSYLDESDKKHFTQGRMESFKKKKKIIF